MHGLIEDINLHRSSAILCCLILLFFPENSYGFKLCKCTEEDITPLERYDRAFAVFTGKVVKIRRNFRPDMHKITFKVYDSWKGARHETIVVKTAGTDLLAFAREGATCGFEFENEHEFLIFSFRKFHDRGLSYTTRCGNIIPLESAEEYISYFGVPQWSWPDTEEVAEPPPTLEELKNVPKISATPLPYTPPPPL